MNEGDDICTYITSRHSINNKFFSTDACQNIQPR